MDSLLSSEYWCNSHFLAKFMGQIWVAINPAHDHKWPILNMPSCSNPVIYSFIHISIFKCCKFDYAKDHEVLQWLEIDIIMRILDKVHHVKIAPISEQLAACEWQGEMLLRTGWGGAVLLAKIIDAAYPCWLVSSKPIHTFTAHTNVDTSTHNIDICT